MQHSNLVGAIPCGRPAPQSDSVPCGRPVPQSESSSYCTYARPVFIMLTIIVLVLVASLLPLSHASAHTTTTPPGRQLLADQILQGTAGNGRINGQLLNGSHKNAPVAGQKVTLQMAQDGSAHDLATTTSDVHGAYTFANLTTDNAVSYALYINFQGGQYISNVVTLDSKPIQRVNLVVYDATLSTSKLAIIRSTVLVQEPDAEKSTFAVSELFDFSNLALQSFVGSLDASRGKPNALFFSLPKNARNVKLDTGFTGYQAIQVTGGFATNAAVVPGDNTFSFSFEVPYTSSVYDFKYEAMYPTVDLSLMVVPSIHASSASLSPQGIMTADQHSYQLFQGSKLLASQEVHVGFEGLPTPASSSSPLNLKLVWLIVGILVLLAIITVASALYRLQDDKKKRPKNAKHAAKSHHRGKKTTKGESSSVDRRQELMHELLELDKAFEAGKLSKATYQERRARMKAHLRTLMSEQEASRQ